MKAAIYNEYGLPESISLAELPIPEPGPEEILVKVHYASVNPIDWKIGEGRLKSVFDCGFPLVVGRDLAGVVERVGARVDEFSNGDKVFAGLPRPGGAFAEYVAVPARYAARAPTRISLKEAASLPLAALTCWQSLVETAGLAAGQTVFIVAGAGGTGSLAVQISRERGATVLTTCSSGNHAYVKELGASDVFDYSADDVMGEIRRRFPGGVDIVFSNVLGVLHEKAYSLVKKDGVLVTIGEPLIPSLRDKYEIRDFDVVVRPSGEQLAGIANLADSGNLRPPEITELALEQCTDAFRMSMDGHVRGKIVLRMV